MKGLCDPGNDTEGVGAEVCAISAVALNTTTKPRARNFDLKYGRKASIAASRKDFIIASAKPYISVQILKRPVIDSFAIVRDAKAGKHLV